MFRRLGFSVLMSAVLLSASKGFAQTSFADCGFFFAGVKGGTLIPNDASFKPLLGNTVIATVDFGVGARVAGPEYWKRYWNNPYFGIGLSFDRIFNSLTGNRLSACTFMENPFAKTGKWDFDWSFGFGVSYITNTFDSVENPANEFIGSHLNAYISAGLGVNYHPSNKVTYYAGVKFSHSSNGTIQLPNKGLNLLQLEAGAKINRSRLSQKDFETPVYQDKNSIAKQNSMFVTLSPICNSSRISREHFFSGEFTMGYRRKFHPCFAYGGGLDIMYDGSLTDNYQPYGDVRNAFAESVFGLVEAYWGSFSIRGGIGYYLHRGVNFSLPYYERIGVYYAFGSRQSLYAGVSIKAHAAHAQFVEWTLGANIISW